MTTREKVLIGLAALIVPGALIYGEYRARRVAELGKANCDAAMVVAAQEIRRSEKCKAMMGSFRSLKRWYERENVSQASDAGSTR